MRQSRRLSGGPDPRLKPPLQVLMKHSSRPVTVVTSAAGLAEAVRHAYDHPHVAVDLESNGFHRYPEHICLVQLGVGESVYIVDPLAIDDVSPLGRLLADDSVEKVMHSADYDIRSLDRDWSFHTAALFDTSIAAAFLGSSRLGLDAVLKEYLGVEVTKTKRIQRSDWTRRPLSSEAMEYAADDVRHLVSLRNKLGAELSRLSRLEWVKEECERLSRVRSQPPDPNWAFLSIKGRSALDARGLGVLRSLHRFREREALRRNTPPFKIISNGKLVELASSPERDLGSVGGLGRFGRGADMGRLRVAIHEGLKEGPVRPPKRGKPDSPRLGPGERDLAAARHQKLKDWRTYKGAALDLDPALTWPATSLERLSRLPQSLEDEIAGPDVRAWQVREFGDDLRRLVASL